MILVYKCHSVTGEIMQCVVMSERKYHAYLNCHALLGPGLYLVMILSFQTLSLIMQTCSITEISGRFTILRIGLSFLSLINRIRKRKEPLIQHFSMRLK